MSELRDSGPEDSIRAQQRMARHLFGLRQFHQLEQRRRNVGKPAFGDESAIARAKQHERHRIRRVRGVRCASVRIAHQFAIAVIGGDKKLATGLVVPQQRGTPGVNRLDRLNRRRQRRCGRPCRDWRS